MKLSSLSTRNYIVRAEGIDCDNPKTLGLRLIAARVDQLEGTMELKRKPPPVFTISRISISFFLTTGFFAIVPTANETALP